jgi:general L-amino acid transport system substrate-binding protein
MADTSPKDPSALTWDLRLTNCIVIVVVTLSACSRHSPTGRLTTIKQRGHLVCGISAGVEGFASVDDTGRYVGFDVDICRAVSAAIFGDPEQVTFVRASSVEDFLRSTEIDVVSRRLTWSLAREGLGLLFGPVTFYDGQGFLVSRRLQVSDVKQLSGKRICVDAGTVFESNVSKHFSAEGLAFDKRVINTPSEIADGLADGRCEAYTADISELGAIRARLPTREDFVILPRLISKEPLAQVVRQADLDLYQILRWTIYAMIDAEERGITSVNVDHLTGRQDAETKRLLGTTPGNGEALGLSERWAYDVIKSVGNYGEVFNRNLGSKSAIQLDRGVNNLWTTGGLIYAPPLR